MSDEDGGKGRRCLGPERMITRGYTMRPNQARALSALAREEERSESYYIRIAVDNYLRGRGLLPKDAPK